MTVCCNCSDVIGMSDFKRAFDWVRYNCLLLKSIETGMSRMIKFVWVLGYLVLGEALPTCFFPRGPLFRLSSSWSYVNELVMDLIEAGSG